MVILHAALSDTDDLFIFRSNDGNAKVGILIIFNPISPGFFSRSPGGGGGGAQRPGCQK